MTTRTRRTMNGPLHAALLLASSLSGGVHAQDAATMPASPELCSCSPTVFEFTLNLDGSCEVNDIEGNPGVDGSFCFVEGDVAVPAPPAADTTTAVPATEAAAPGTTTAPIETILDIAVGNENFSTLVAAVTAAGLADALAGDGPLTVFAPTDEAFAALPEGALDGLLADPAALGDVLKYHVVAAEATSDTLASGEVETLNGDSVTVTVSDEGVMVNDATVVMADILASNGVIHVIDKVLLPPADDPEPPAERPVCAFCADGMPDPALLIPTGDEVTCDQAAQYAATLAPDNSMCATTQLAQAVCCPAMPAMTDSADEEVRRLTSAVRRQREARREGHRAMRRRLQDLETTASADEAAEDPAIVEIVSVQFLEFDTSGDLTVINQDDTYADVSLVDGDRLKFSSASSFLDTSLPLEEQMSSPALVPGGASIILYGKTASGEVVRNRFFWMYDMNCGRENNPVMVGDDIGWVTVAETSNAWPAFCPALPDGSPTIAPRSNEPTLSPSVSPVKSPTASPAMSMATTTAPTPRTSVITPRPDGGWSGGYKPAFGGKSSKAPKTYKPGKSGKGSKSAKSSKSSKGSKSVHGKAGKPDGWNGGTYNMERVAGFTVNSAEGACSFGMTALLSLVASALLFSRQ